MIEHNASDTPQEENPFTDNDVAAVNRLLGIGDTGILHWEDMPHVINIAELWLQTASRIQEHPADRELFIGWALELLGKRHRARYQDILTEDARWVKPFRVAFYRGYVSDNLTEPQWIRRSDMRIKGI